MLENIQIAELLAVAAEAETGHKQRALRRASRRALMWPEECADILAEDRSLTELTAIGPWTAKLIADWIRDEVEPPAPPPERAGFITVAHARRVIRETGAPLLRGDLQNHTLWSDGSTPIETMAETALASGYEYLAITDHTKGLPIANGMNEERLAAQARDVERVRALMTEPAILHGLEMNLSVLGEEDMEREALEPIFPVLGAFHGKLRLKEDQTERYLMALRNPTIHVLAHPRGRIYNTRVGLSADWSRVFAEAAERGVALECDCYPDRQDLNVDLLREAAAAGVTISVGTDAHSPGEMAFAEIGRAALALAGVPDAQILNRMSVDDLRAWGAARRERAAV